VARLHVTEWGNPDGRPVVCVHGVTGHGGRFRRLAERFTACRVLGVDLRGHGRSTWQAPWGIETHVADLVETTDALGVSQAVWVGHSFGGRLVPELAHRHHHRVERAVLLDPAMHIEPAVATERAALLMGDLSFGSPDEAIDARLADGTLFTTPRETLVEEAHEHLEQGEDGRYRWRYSPAAVIVAWSEMSTPPPLYPSVPTLLVLGERSWIPPYAPETGGLQVARVPGGHVVLWDAPELVADAIDGFL
jgi:lipase